MRIENPRLRLPGVLVLAALLLGGAILYWFRSQDRDTATTLSRIRLLGFVRIGYANEAPYGYLNSKTGEVTGESPEIARVILKRMGVKEIKPVVAEFGALIPGLKAGRFDIIAAGMYVLPERCKEIAFSNPTYKIGEAFLVRRNNPKDLHSYRDVATHNSARLGVMGGSVQHGYAKHHHIPSSRMVIFPDYPSAVSGLLTDRVDAVAGTQPTIHNLLRKADSPKLVQARPFKNPVIDGKPAIGYGAFGFRKRDKALRQAFNRHLRDFLGTPEHRKLVRPFGFSTQTLPGDVTAEELCEKNTKTKAR